MEGKKVNYELDGGEVNIILTGLGELPAKHTFHLIDKLRKGFEEQNPNENSTHGEPQLLNENGNQG